MGPQIAEEKSETTGRRLRVRPPGSGPLVKCRRDFEEQVDTGGRLRQFRIGRSTRPDKLLVRVFDQAVGGVGHTDFAASDRMDNDEVIPLPMGDARKRRFVAQAPEREAHRQRAQAERFCGFGDPKEVHSSFADLTQIA